MDFIDEHDDPPGPDEPNIACTTPMKTASGAVVTGPTHKKKLIGRNENNARNRDGGGGEVDRNWGIKDGIDS